MTKTRKPPMAPEHRQEIANSFRVKLHRELWFDRPTVLHGHWKDCYQYVRNWVVTGNFSEQDEPIFGIIRKMVRDHIKEIGK